MISLPIIGSDMGLQTNKKPYLIPEKAFQQLQNAYVYRERVKIRDGIKSLGTLQRTFGTLSFFKSTVTPFNFNLLVQSGYVSNITKANPGVVTTTYPHNLVNGNLVVFTGVAGMTQVNGTTNGPFTVTVISATTFSIGDTSGYTAYTSGGFFISNQPLTSTEPNARIIPGTVILKIGSPGQVFTDQGNGILTSDASNYGVINYSTGAVSITTNVASGTATTVTFSYAPGLPVMGLQSREINAINDEQTVAWDTKYAYVFSGTEGEGGAWGEFIPGTTWNATDSDFFTTANFRGSSDGSRLFFETNGVSSATNQMYYTNGNTWTLFNPAISSSTYLFAARFLVPYYGRLVAFNTTEGATVGGQINVFNRARFAAIGDPTASNAWRVDIFGQGGFIDAPVNEAITGVEFVKNTLVVTFEYSTWQFRYVGEYGLPFIWERISSDFGSASPSAPVLFNDHLLTIGDRAIIGANAVAVDRIDLAIPDLVFSVNNYNNGTLRVGGIRDYQKELVYWTYNDSNNVAPDQYFPNTVLVYNYRNNTFAQFRDNITAFGTFQGTNQITWDSQTVTWDNETITWDNEPEENDNFPEILAGNQQGFTYFYGYEGEENQQRNDVYYYISAIDLTQNPYQITIANHNLSSDEFIYITELMFVDTGVSPPVALTCSLNNQIYKVQVVDNNTLAILLWSGTNYIGNPPIVFTPTPTTPTYEGGGMAAQLPVLFVQTKDFNPFQEKGLQCKLSYVDFLMDATTSASMTVQVYQNTNLSQQVNVPLGQQEVETYLPQPYYVPNSDVAWHRFWCTVAGQYINLAYTYDDALMNSLNTHAETWVMNSFTLHMRPGGKLIF